MKKGLEGTDEETINIPPKESRHKRSASAKGAPPSPVEHDGRSLILSRSMYQTKEHRGLAVRTAPAEGSDLCGRNQRPKITTGIWGKRPKNNGSQLHAFARRKAALTSSNRWRKWGKFLIRPGTPQKTQPPALCQLKEIFFLSSERIRGWKGIGEESDQVLRRILPGEKRTLISQKRGEGIAEQAARILRGGSRMQRA